MNERQTAFGHFHPVPAFVYITSLTLVTMFTSHPVILALSLAGAALSRCRFIRCANSFRIFRFTRRFSL